MNPPKIAKVFLNFAKVAEVSPNLVTLMTNDCDLFYCYLGYVNG